MGPQCILFVRKIGKLAIPNSGPCKRNALQIRIVHSRNKTEAECRQKKREIGKQEERSAGETVLAAHSNTELAVIITLVLKQLD